MVEISGPFSSGKTELLMQIIINVILPKEIYGIDFNGFEGSVVYIDTSYKFSILRFVMLIEKCLKKYKGNDLDAKISDEFIKNCLKRFYKMTCSTSKELIVSLLSLEPFLKASSDVFLLIIDDFYSYHWLDKLENGQTKQSSSQYPETVFEILKRYIKEFHLNIVLTKLDTYLSSSGNQMFMSRFHVQDKSTRGTRIYSIKKGFSIKSSSFVCDYQITSEGLKIL